MTEVEGLGWIVDKVSEKNSTTLPGSVSRLAFEVWLCKPSYFAINTVVLIHYFKAC